MMDSEPLDYDDIDVPPGLEAHPYRVGYLNGAMTHHYALRKALEKFFDETNGRWQYHDEYAHIPLYELDALREAYEKVKNAR